MAYFYIKRDNLFCFSCFSFKVTSFVSAVQQIFQQEGIGGFFAGYSATLVRDIPYTMLELGIYENLKLFLQNFRRKSNNNSSGNGQNTQDELMAAALTGGVTAFFTTPLDLIKTKLMMQVNIYVYISIIQYYICQTNNNHLYY
jgi:hypothetical protein